MNLKNLLFTGTVAVSLGTVEAGLLYIEPLEKPAWYDDAWRITEEYTGVVAKQPPIFLIKLNSFPCPPTLSGLLKPFKEECYGLYIPFGPIFFAEGDFDDIDDVLHEMLHAHYVFGEKDVADGIKRIKSDSRFASTFARIKTAN